jgi:class 3 adenylate cyclase/streptogramin lyase
MARLPGGTVTFLFSDVEGSTRLLRALGQERYGQALADYQLLIRESCTSLGGQEVDTQGDSFFFAFATARDAASAAAEAQGSIARHAWPDGTELRARIGLHTGAASVSEGRYVGLSVHRAARVCAAGHGGQILLSQTTAAVLEDEELGDLGLRELGRHRLKDFERPVRLHQLDLPGLPNRFPPLKTERTGALRRRHALLAAGLAALLAAAVAAAVAMIGGGERAAITGLGPTSVGVIDPKTNRLVAEIDLGFTSPLIAAGEGHVWIADPQGSGLTKIDPKTRKIVKRFSLDPGAIPTGIAVGEGSVWMGENHGRSLAVLELGPELGDPRQAPIVVERSRRPISRSESVVLAIGEGAVFALEPGSGQVSRIDGAAPSPLPDAEGVDAGSIAAGHGGIWLGGRNGVTKIDSSTGSTLARLPVFGLTDSAATSIQVGGGFVWFVGSAQPKLFRIDSAGANLTRTTFNVGRGPKAIAVGEGAVWVANNLDGTVSRVDPKSGAVATITLGAPPAGIVAAYGSVWTSPGEPVR